MPSIQGRQWGVRWQSPAGLVHLSCALAFWGKGSTCPEDSDMRARSTKALNPEAARPTMSAFISRVPS